MKDKVTMMMYIPMGAGVYVFMQHINTHEHCQQSQCASEQNVSTEWAYLLIQHKLCHHLINLFTDDSFFLMCATNSKQLLYQHWGGGGGGTSPTGYLHFDWESY